MREKAHTRRAIDWRLAALFFTAVVLWALPSGSAALATSGEIEGAAVEIQHMATRDAQQWPFPWDSIWNMPLGSGAEYVDADIGPAGQFGVYADEDIIIMEPTAPRVNVIEHDAAWSGRDRCASALPGRVHMTGVPVPTDFTTEVNNDGTPNAAAAILMPDGETIRQTQPLHVCGRGGQVVSQYRFPDDNIRTGDGIDGAHGGASMSSLGGTIRVGELVPGGTITHALKVVIDTGQYGYYNPASDPTPGYRWPATTTDSSAASYGGSNPAVEMGSLLALRPSFDVAGLRTEPARMLAQAMQDYGGYLVDSSGWDTHYFATEFGPDGRVIDEFGDAWGFPFLAEQTSTCANAANPSCAWSKDMADLFSSLHVVDNNSPQNIGGPGTRRVACAPPFSDGTGGAPASCSPPSAGCGGGALAQEAEAGDLQGTMTVIANGAASGDRFVQARVGTRGRPGPGSDYAEYCVAVPSAGEYRLDATIWAPNNADDSFYVTVDDNPLALWDMRIGSGFRTDSVSHRGGADPVVWDLAAGDHVIRFHHREDGAGIDNFELVPLRPTPGDCGGLTQEAEDGVLAGTMRQISNSAASGGQFVQSEIGTRGRPYPNTDYAQYCMTTTVGGTYRIDALAWAPNSGDDSFYVTIDGSAAALWDIPNASGFANRTVSDRSGANPATWNLAPGDHIVRFHHREDGAGIDRVQLVQVGQSPTPTSTPVPPVGDELTQNPMRIVSRWHSTSGHLQRLSDADSAVSLEQLTPEGEQWWSLQWNFEPVSSGIYRIRARWGPDDGYLTRNGTNDGNESVPTATVYLDELNESWTSQLWRVTRRPEGHYSIVNQWAPESGALTRSATLVDGSYVPGPELRLRAYNANWWSQGWLLREA